PDIYTLSLHDALPIFNDHSLDQKSYYSFKKEVTSQSLPEVIENVNSLMTVAVNREWQKDLEYQKRHFTLMSGGMDSRTNALVAKDRKSTRLNSSHVKI